MREWKSTCWLARRHRHVLVATALLIAACAPGPTVSVGPPCVSTYSTGVVPSEVTLAPGEQVTFRAAARDGCDRDLPMYGHWAWSVSDTSVAVIDSLSGVLTARQPGVTVVLAAMSEARYLSASTSVSVSSNP